MPQYDVLIIGGGINGVGIARDCALRGFKTILIEKKDFSAGATGTCSGMIHGGPRYLEYDIATTRSSCLDSGYIQKIAPFLLFRIPFIFPVLKGDKYNIELIETFMEAYDEFVALKNGRPHTRLTRTDAMKLEPGLTDRIVGGVTMDEWGCSPFRLCILNALSAHRYGAEIRNHSLVEKLLIDESRQVIGAKVRNTLTGEHEELRARIVFNAGGPWSPQIAKMAGAQVKIRPAKGAHLVFDRRLSNVAITAETIDGRSIFVIPYENTSLVGTTDDDYYGDMDNVTVTRDEVQYLLEGIERVFPSIRRERIIRAFAGVRPTLYDWRKNEDELSREHAVFDHEQTDGVKGLLSIAGGKLASYRLMSEHATDVICQKLGVPAKCRTHLEALPGGEGNVNLHEAAAEHDVPAYILQRLYQRYGTEYAKVLAEEPKESARSVICQCESITEAEIRHVIRHEWARTLDDVRRRTRLGGGPCQGRRCTLAAASILAEELHLGPDELTGIALEFLQERWKGKVPILSGLQLAQEEIGHASHFLSANIHQMIAAERHTVHGG
ncbi:FAD-dependent oxidoreductase [Candidatus Poribacteria bacterium]|nr:FAD-dependent oxidoreductase [Candidatus Poribacteria bacterium]